MQTSQTLFASGLDQWLHWRFAMPLSKAVALEAFFPLALAFVLAGFFWPASDRVTWLLRLWPIGAARLLALMPNVMTTNYYYAAILLPGGAGLMALALSQLTPGCRSGR